MKKDAKIIHSPQLANFLLARDYTIIKLKPKHGNPKESVYVFKIEEGFFDCITEWMEQNEE